MEIKVESGDITLQDVDAILVNLFEGIKSPEGVTATVDAALDGGISKLIEDGEISGAAGETTLIHTLGKMIPRRVLVVGLGKQSDFTIDTVRRICGESVRKLRQTRLNSVATVAHGGSVRLFSYPLIGQSIAEGIILGLYKFDKYKTKTNDPCELSEITIIEPDRSKISDIEKGVKKGITIGDSVNLCRDMVNEPANYMTPSRMAEVALDVANEADLELEVLEKSDMEKHEMGALLGVAQGSEEPPKFIILRYTGDPGNMENNIGILGKGITFDSGGISIKPSPNMGAMKGDMAGGASVISAMKAIGKIKPKINISAIVAATENMPSGSAQRPGDIVRAANGKTIEIDNTDAEGRLVLADAASYAQSIGLTRIIDVATLTGAMSIALGKVCTGAFGNDKQFTEQVISAGAAVGERIWELPVYEDYKEQYKSDVADIKNTGGRGAGSITGAMIIGEFVGDSSWVHLDIAATSTSDSAKGYNPKGASGIPVRTLIALSENLGSSEG